MKPKYSKHMRFPVSIAIPLHIAVNSGLPRKIAIDSPNKELPLPLVEWLRSDPRFSDWLEDEPVKAAEPFDFSTLDGIGKARAKKFTDAGITTAPQFVDAGIQQISDVGGVSLKTAQDWINQIKKEL